MKVIHKFNMDLARRGIIPRIDAVQDDKYSRILEFSLYAEGIEWNPPVNAEIVVRYTRPDGKTGNYRALVTGDVAGTINGNKVSVTLAPIVLAVAGTAKVAVGLINDDVEITTFFAEINIQKNPGADTASSSFGDATVSDVAAGKTFTSDRGQGTGTLEEVESGKNFSNSGGDFLYVSDSDLVSPFFVAKKTTSADKIIREGALVSVNVDATKMGDAEPGDVVSGKTFTSKHGLKMTGTRASSAAGELESASGVVTIEETCNSFVIDTGLATIDSIIVSRSAMPSDENGTWGWLHSPAGNMTNYLSYGSNVSWRYGIKSSKLTDNGDGSVTVNQYTDSYPIIPGEYNWIAYGSK